MRHTLVARTEPNYPHAAEERTVVETAPMPLARAETAKAETAKAGEGAPRGDGARLHKLRERVRTAALKTFL